MAVRKEFQGKVKEALNNENLRKALDNFGRAYPASREKAYQGKDIEALRDYISRKKRAAAQHIDQLIDRFTTEVEKKGGKVYFAKTDDDAKEYILNLAKKENVKTIVKSKSMASEEIHLNDYLEKENLEVVETDLGEWIIQLMGQKPSHMVMPAIHLTRNEIADTFSRYLGEKIPPDPLTLTKVARKELRKKFLKADMGISGANMAVAENGTLVIMTNEGNARLTTTLPRIHVALVGMEKFVADLETVSKVLEALPRSATGQEITSYVTMISGAVPTWVDNGVGEKQLHVVILDNGRREMIDDPVFKEALQCIRCASCLNVCPVYQLVGGHVYGHIYAGGIGTILTAFFNGEDEAFDPQNLCISCNKCATICPGKINIPKLIKELRLRLTEKKGLSFPENYVLKNILGQPKTFHKWLRRAQTLQKPLVKDGYIRYLPLAFSKHTEKRSLPKIADKPLRDLIPEIKKEIKKPKAKAAFYSGCVIDFCYPEVGEAVFKTLQDNGIEMVFPSGQSCCGAPASYMGDRKTAIKLAKSNIEALESADADYVVSACPTCTHVVRDEFPELLEGEKEWYSRAKEISKKVRDYSDLMVELTGNKKQNKRKETTKVTYHDSCHYKRELRLSDRPRILLNNNKDVELIEMNECDRCCGFGGSYTAKFPEISSTIMERKLKNIADSGAEVVVTDCPGCMVQLKGGLDKKNSRIKVKHTAEILAEGRTE